MQPYSNAAMQTVIHVTMETWLIFKHAVIFAMQRLLRHLVSDFSQRRSLTLRIVWGLWSLRCKFACICCMSWVMMVVMMMSVMQNAVMVFLQMWLFPVFVMILLWFCFLLLIDRCHNIWDFKMHKKGTIFILFRLVFFIFIVENFLCPKVKKGHFCL